MSKEKGKKRGSVASDMAAQLKAIKAASGIPKPPARESPEVTEPPARETPSQRKKRKTSERLKHRATFDLPPGMKDELSEYAAEYKTTMSQIAGFFLADAIQRYRAGDPDLDPSSFLIPSASMRYLNNIEIDYEPPLPF